MNRRRFLAAAPLVLLPSCGAMEAAGQAAGMLNADGPANLWGIAKGVAEVALLAEPGLGPLVSAAIAAGDALSADATSTSATAAASASTLVSHASALLVQTAGVVTVTPNQPRAA